MSIGSKEKKSIMNIAQSGNIRIGAPSDEESSIVSVGKKTEKAKEKVKKSLGSTNKLVRMNF